MTNHHPAPNPSGGPAPTPKQQAYIRRLALDRGISFTPPRTKREATRLIDELRQRRPDSRSARRRETRQVQADMAQRPGDATRIRRDEATGHGSSATWNTDRPATPAPTGERRTNPPVEIARYKLATGERVIQGQRILGVVRLIDVPAIGTGRRYLIERELSCRAEVAAVVSDYLQQAHELQAIPADPATRQPEASS